jgi:hypothetical protein
MKYWEIIADNLHDAGWSWATSQLSTRAGERSGLLTLTAMTETFRCADEKLTALLEREAAIWTHSWGRTYE